MEPGLGFRVPHSDWWKRRVGNSECLSLIGGNGGDSECITLIGGNGGDSECITLIGGNRGRSCEVGM